MKMNSADFLKLKILDLIYFDENNDVVVTGDIDEATHQIGKISLSVTDNSIHIIEIPKVKIIKVECVIK